MQADHASTIEHIWQTTKAIEHAVAVGEWEQAARLAGERSPLLTALAPPLSPAALDTLRQVHAIDAQIAGAAQSAQHTLHHEYRAAMQATQNANLYQKVAHF